MPPCHRRPACRPAREGLPLIRMPGTMLHLPVLIPDRKIFLSILPKRRAARCSRCAAISATTPQGLGWWAFCCCIATRNRLAAL